MKLIVILGAKRQKEHKIGNLKKHKSGADFIQIGHRFQGHDDHFVSTILSRQFSQIGRRFPRSGEHIF